MDPILLVGFPAVGDFVRCHSAIRILAKRFPDCPIDVVTSPGNVAFARFMPHVRKAWALNRRPMQLGLAARRNLAGELRKENYGSAYLMTSTIKAALIPFMAGIPERIGYPQELQFGLVNRLPADWLRHLWAFGPRKTRLYEEVCSIVTLGAKPMANVDWPAPQMIIPAAELDDWRSRAGVEADRPALAIFTGDMESPRSWPMERFISIAKDYSNRGWAVWIVGGPRERDAANRIRAEVPHAVDFTTTPLIDVMYQLGASALFLGVNGGMSHAAAALNIPCVLIFGSNLSYLHAPVNEHVRLVEPPISTPSWIEDTLGVSEERVREALAGALEEARHPQSA
ncbi:MULTISPECIES: lipopolysaccharide heptosyltransferase II [unclassified Mesorhizobium]|uniref:lipopolysaccharide heptosyltransferase II n=1 Tax=unclassified Mesorhizobium TaxID=325217 RepID=UPI000FC9F7F3|nr:MULTISPECIES: lipopolysaccharide heptosyltransferase II [unclassified Mesorhizobium]RUW29846.1 lipopolysaccharide heptosyltransferase II [Mesorhizobium sp. M1E.F.Ca.ET.041.01.1.1]RWD92600.1 MAG: lipopolysaccharide heptosyltransferase II [Mesorhizobium sp.]RWD95143.1 MAG: lipopolysaccharide heptosyltransferase II [Mesorhizobium sp.]TIV48966.1 MAG: lipopolysaccharide heptosyltransferase II [Mesorhizobium sp.]